jgi:hypothetical protein
MSYRLEFGVGCGVDKDNHPIPRERVNQALDVILHTAANFWGGGNFSFGRGFWINPEQPGVIVREDSVVLVVDVLDFHPDYVDKLVRTIKQQLNQAAVHVAVISLERSENL